MPPMPITEDDNGLLASAFPRIDSDTDDEINEKTSSQPPSNDPTTLRIPKRLREGTRRDMIPKRLRAAHRSISQKEGKPIQEILMVTSKGDPDVGYDDPLSASELCVLNIGGSSYGSDFRLLEEWVEGLDGFVEMVAGKGKAYTFLMFSTPESAHEALQKLHKRPIADARICLVQKVRNVPVSLADVTVEDPEEIARLIPGLIVVPEFITEEEEKGLMEIIEDDKMMDWIPLSSRKVGLTQTLISQQHFGVAFNYSTNYFGSNTLEDHPILPPWTTPLITRLQTLTKDYTSSNQLTVNYYPPGSGIRPHVDTHSSFDGPVVSLSLNAPAVMEFRYLPPPPPTAFDFHQPTDASLPGEFKLVSVLLPRRSVVIMSGESRFGWEHSIRPRASDVIAGRKVERGLRVSLTFRWVRLPVKRECACPYWWLCDAQMPGGALPERFKEEKDRRKKWW
ncbi:hypothetical protein HDU67_005061 [Dinochytrium kinnereticum]|nr:hypothetical protein HDU67_005061 [Dinochytrium kinnereticum]